MESGIVMKERISIIVPVYKVEEYLARCVDSILAQTYTDLEIILVDDGSPDNSGEICDAYAEKDDRIKVIHKANGGLSDARNTGIDQATGSYLTFLDSDDWVHESYIAYLYDLLKDNDAEISLCNFLKTTQEEVPLEPSQGRETVLSSDAVLERYIDLGDAFHPQLVMACGKLFKAELFDTIRFPVGRLHEDEFTTYKLFHYAKKSVLSMRSLYYYWQREDSIMGSGFKTKNKLDYMDALTERAAFFHTEGRKALSDRTYKSLFSEGLSTILVLDERNEETAKKQVFALLKQARNALRHDHNWKVGIFFEGYLLMPGMVARAYKAFRSLKK